MVDAPLMAGKKGLVMGIANDRSLAYGIAKTVADHGAELALTYQGDALAKRVMPIAEKLGAPIVAHADVTDDESLDQLFRHLEETWGRPVLAGVCVLGLAITAGFQLLAPGDPTRPLVGASGLVALLLAAFIVRFFAEGLHYTAVGWWQGWVHTRFWLPSYALLLGWFAFEVAMQLAGDGLGTTRGVSYTLSLIHI